MKIRQKTQVTFQVDGAGVSHSRTDIAVRDVSTVIDEPTERGGTNEGPSPTETGIAALIGCTNVIGNKCAKKLGVDIGHLHITAAVEFDRRGVLLQEEVDVPFPHIALTVVADGPASHEDLQRVAAEVAKFCPLSKLYKGAGTTIEETWRKA